MSMVNLSTSGASDCSSNAPHPQSLAHHHSTSNNERTSHRPFQSAQHLRPTDVGSSNGGLGFDPSYGPLAESPMAGRPTRAHTTLTHRQRLGNKIHSSTSTPVSQPVDLAGGTVADSPSHPLGSSSHNAAANEASLTSPTAGAVALPASFRRLVNTMPLEYNVQMVEEGSSGSSQSSSFTSDEDSKAAAGTTKDKSKLGGGIQKLSKKPSAKAAAHNGTTHPHDDSDEEDDNAHSGTLSRKPIKLPPAPVPDDVEEELAAELAACPGKKSCNLSRLELVKVPDVVPTFSHLHELSLCENHIRDLPAGLFDRLLELEVLNLSNNEIREVPFSVFKLPQLRTLLLDHNRLTAMPFDAPGAAANLNCPNLRTVGLEWNGVEQFPGPLLGHCLLLENLYLAENLPVQSLDYTPEQVQQLFGSRRQKLLVKMDNRPRLMAAVEHHALEGKAKFPNLEISWNKIYPDKVLDYLYLGSLRTAQCVEVYRDLNIRFVLTAGRHLTVVLDEDMEQLELGVDDIPGEDMSPFFAPAFDFIEQARKERKGVLIHCFAGLSRSVTVTVAYIMWAYYPMTRDEALALVRTSRPNANPNEGFLLGLLKYQESLRTMHENGQLTTSVVSSPA